MLRRLPTLLALLSLAGGTTACTSYILGSRASEDGSILVARNDDGEGAVSPSSLVYHPARQGPAVFHANENRLALELPGPGLAYLSVPAGPLADAASGRNTSGEAAGFNAAGVAISATESIYNSAAALSAGGARRGLGVWPGAVCNRRGGRGRASRCAALALRRRLQAHRPRPC